MDKKALAQNDQYDGLERHYFECDCGAPEHMMKFLFIKDEKPPMLFAYFFLNNPDNIFKRIWVAIKYVLGYKCKYGHFDEWILGRDDADRLIGLLENYKEYCDEHSKG